MFLRNVRTLYSNTARISFSSACNHSVNRLPTTTKRGHTQTFLTPNFQQDPRFVVAGTFSAKRFYSSSKDDINKPPYNLLKLNDMGFNLTTFDCHKWHVEQGEAIKTGDVLLEIQCRYKSSFWHDNFVTTTVRAKQSGYLAKMLVNENTSKKIPVDTPIAVIAENESDLRYSKKIDLFIENTAKKKTVAATINVGESCIGERYTGTLNGKDGLIYHTGELKDNKPHGQGTLTYADGSLYSGGWKDGKLHGEGTFTGADGRLYSGGWKDDKKHGQGTFTGSKGSLYMYVGEWKDNKRHGHGTLTDTDGNSYSGGWKDDKFHGEGTFVYADGDSYSGEWKYGGFKDSKYHGEGTLTGVSVLTDEYLGSRVLVQWYGGRTYLGTFDKMSSSGRYHITYDDGDVRNYSLQRTIHGDLFALNREKTDDIHRFIIQDTKKHKTYTNTAKKKTVDATINVGERTSAQKRRAQRSTGMFQCFYRLVEWYRW